MYKQLAPDVGGITNSLDNSKFEDDTEESYYIEDEEDILQSSSSSIGFGTNAVMQAIKDLTKNRNPNLYDTFLVNVDTLIRNVVTKEKSIEEIKADTKRDLNGLLDTITLYMKSVSNLLESPIILVYIPEYITPQVKLHERVFKSNSVKDIVKTVHEDFIKEDNLKVKKQIRTTYNDIDVYELMAGDKSELPYKVLTRFINSQARFSNPGGIRNVLKNMLMISHYPLDYYFLHNFPRANIIESFTGKILKKEQLGLKVFKDGFIPFNRVTHLLFGDSIQLMPMAKGRRGKNNNRKRLMDLAKRQNWNFRTPDEIASLVGATGQVPKEILMNIRF